MEPKLDSRLALLRAMTPPCRVAADVGTDHGFLICALVASGQAQRGVATDINPMPLEKARKEAARQGLLDRIALYCTDGLTGVPPQELDAVVIAGMGGETIAHIMEEWPWSRTPGVTWLLQPMTKPERLRAWLFGHGYEILEERCCTAAGKTYSVLKACYTGASGAHLPLELYLGRVDPGRDKESRRYAENCLRQLEIAARGLECSPRRQDEARETLDLVRDLRRLLEEKELL